MKIKASLVFTWAWGKVQKVTVENSFDVGLSVFLASLFGVFSTDSIVFNLVLLQGCDHPKAHCLQQCIMIHS